MRKNKFKDMMDVALIILLIISVLGLVRSENATVRTICGVAIILGMILYNILNIIIWKCPKCGRHLPDNKILFNNIEHCPYCDAKIEEDK